MTVTETFRNTSFALIITLNDRHKYCIGFFTQATFVQAGGDGDD